MRVVVTGIGWVTSLGRGRDEVWQALLAGRSGLSPVRSFDAGRYPSKLGGEIDGFATDHGADQPGRASQMAWRRPGAIADARLDLTTLNRAVGAAMGTTSGEPREVEHFNDLHVAGKTSEIGAEFLRRYPCHTIVTGLMSEPRPARSER